MCLLNVRSVNNKVAKICDILESHDLDILFLTETWMLDGDTYLEGSLCPPAYNISRLPRPGGARGGGLALIYKSEFQLSFTRVNQSASECGLVKLFVGQTVYQFVVMYRPPSYRYDNFMSDFKELLDSVVLLHAPVYFVGDFNFHVNDCSNAQGAEFCDVLDNYDFC